MRTTPELCLWHATGHEWEEISDLYLNFRLKSAPFGKMCVVTPDTLRALKPRILIPTHDRDLHNPDRFVEKYFKSTRAKQKVQLATPAFKYDLDSFPEFTIYGSIRSLAKIYMVKCEVKLDGDLLIKKSHSDNNITLSNKSLNMLSMNASTTVNQLISTLKVEINYEAKTCTLGSSVVGEYGATSFMIKSPTSFTVSATPQKVNTLFGNWEIEGQLGYDIDCTIIDNDNQNEVSLPEYQPHQNSDLTTKEAVAGTGLLATLILIGVGIACF